MNYVTCLYLYVQSNRISDSVHFLLSHPQVSPLRAVLYMCAQCGGAIAGTALVKGIEGKALTDAALNRRKGAFGLEFVLTFLIVYAYCASRVDYAARTGSAHQQPGSSLYGTTAGHQGHYGTSGTLGAPTGLFGSGGGIFGGGYRLELHTLNYTQHPF